MVIVGVIGMIKCLIDGLWYSKKCFIPMLIGIEGLFLAGEKAVPSIIGMIIIAALIFNIIRTQKTKAKEEEEKESLLLEIGGNKLDRFFVECVLASCNDFTMDKNIEKAKLLANKYSLSYPEGVQALYEQGLKAHEALSQQMLSDRLLALQKTEREEYYKLNRYSSLFGRDKRIAMLTDRMNELRKLSSDMQKNSDLLMRATIQKESDWAVWGGIADGLAGPGAGVATALDIQRKNSAIRRQNQANLQAAIPAYMSISNSISNNIANADRIEKEIQTVKEKLLSDVPASEVFEKLTITNPLVEVSESGAFRVSATVSVKEELHIFDDVPAIADGTIVAHVFEDEQEVGTANLVLPVNGVSDKTGLVGMGLSGAHQDKKQTLTFSAGRMWLMER